MTDQTHPLAHMTPYDLGAGGPDPAAERRELTFRRLTKNGTYEYTAFCQADAAHGVSCTKVKECYSNNPRNSMSFPHSCLASIDVSLK